MALENYCASCHHLSEKESYKKFYCYRESKEIKATDSKCRNYLEAYRRSDDKRIQMYQASGGTIDNRFYITTVMCNILGYSDDNYYLQTLRSFRDNVMKQNKRYILLLVVYDVIGPQIASCLLQDENNKEIASSLFNNYITKAVTAIENNKTNEAINIYSAMTQVLTERYNLTQTITIDPDSIDIESLGHGKPRKRALELL